MPCILPITPLRSNLKAHEHPNYRRYRDRMFAKLTPQRRFAKKYDKTTLSLASHLNLAKAQPWLKSMINLTWTLGIVRHRLLFCCRYVTKLLTNINTVYTYIPNAFSYILFYDTYILI
jgi:hypothetical protein